jgi:hypothetical protein
VKSFPQIRKKAPGRKTAAKREKREILPARLGKFPRLRRAETGLFERRAGKKRTGGLFVFSSRRIWFIVHHWRPRFVGGRSFVDRERLATNTL